MMEMGPNVMIGVGIPRDGPVPNDINQVITPLYILI